ncbi:hypothetical protein [Nonomuraea dietziae]|uniref:hypothetical protein n=1 Tax=Nonomuraea dietziae TaxID=65515 RepID=UPI0031D781CF
MRTAISSATPGERPAAATAPKAEAGSMSVESVQNSSSFWIDACHHLRDRPAAQWE